MLNNTKERFLTAYSEIRNVAGAARRAGIHRATVYRWQADPAFITAMEAAWKCGYDKWYKEVYEPTEAQRQAARARRKAELLPQRRRQARLNFGH
jgi:hypothetical protein